MSTVTSMSESQSIAKKVYRAFFSPSRYEVKPSEQEVIDWGNNYRLPFDGGELAVTTWGSSGSAVRASTATNAAASTATGEEIPNCRCRCRTQALSKPKRSA